ncbi:MAG TPA: M28 family metallopeptidase [Longimicrobium sp.]|nr:M28 family metallopeptidase [Longimicrobium sp.]
MAVHGRGFAIALCRGSLVAAGLLAACAPARIAPRGEEARIRPEALRAHMEFLADDRLEGRESGTRGYDLAALYVAAQFQEMGLQRAGSDGYFQHVPLRVARLVPGSVALTVAGPRGERRFADPGRVVAYPSVTETEQRIQAPAVFAGYGIVAPEYGRDDYARLDVRGKYVVLLGGPPPGFSDEVAAHFGSTDEQRARAAERGAVGVLLVYTPAFEARFPFARLGDVALQPTLDWVDPSVPRAGDGGMRTGALVHPAAAAELLQGAPRDLDAVMREASTRPPDGFPLAVTVTLERRATHQRLSSANVAGLVPGADPRLTDEVVAVVGHLDHVGIGTPRDGDSIYNGALDNASGIAMILEIARVLRTPDARPARSILFVALTAEEKGLVGSDYFARNPTVAPRRIVAVINLDGAMPFYEFTDVIGFGAESSTLGRSFARVAAGMGLTVSPDPAPELTFFTRSDHYSFVQQGIPSLFPQMGSGSEPGRESGVALARRFATEHLHQPTDQLSLPIDYGVLARYTELLRRLAAEVADAPERPLWYEGDFFGNRFAPDAPKARR